MRRISLMRSIAGLAVLAALAALVAVFAHPAGAAAPRRVVLPPQAHPNGRTYSQWAALWWTWALTQPVDSNPLLDETGEDCAVGQTGRVWFLAGTLTSDRVTRECTVPAGTKLFFPVVNYFYCALAEDPPEQQTEEYVRSQVAFFREAAGDLEASVDGRPVRDLQRYFEESVLFDVVLPANNLFELPAGTLASPCADAGFYLMLAPLRPGTHTIHFAGSVEDDFTLDVTYEITVV